VTDLTPPEETPPGTVRVTVFLHPEAWTAASETANRLDMSRTDVINMAVLAFGQLTAKPGSAFAFEGFEPIGDGAS
jgi:hypothetical protein